MGDTRLNLGPGVLFLLGTWRVRQAVEATALSRLHSRVQIPYALPFDYCSPIVGSFSLPALSMAAFLVKKVRTKTGIKKTGLYTSRIFRSRIFDCLIEQRFRSQPVQIHDPHPQTIIEPLDNPLADC